MGDHELTLRQRRQRFASDIAPGIAAEVLGGDANPFDSAIRRLTTRASWFTRGNHLAVIAGPYDDERDADLALAYGLFHAGDRQLVVILPSDEKTSRPTLARAPWISRPLQVWTYDLAAAEGGGPGALAPQAIDDPAGMLRRYVSEGWGYCAGAADRTADVGDFLGPHAAWVERLTTWAQNDDALVAAHRQSYLAWHCQGGIVLKIAQTTRGLRVTGGIQYSDPARRPERIDLTAPLTSAEAHRLVGQAALAASRLLDGDDGGRREHSLQAALARVRPVHAQGRGVWGG
jgi:hypothetical protein